MTARGLNNRRAARYMGVSAKTITRWRRAGLITPVDIGGVELYDVKALDALFDVAVRSLAKQQ